MGAGGFHPAVRAIPRAQPPLIHAHRPALSHHHGFVNRHPFVHRRPFVRDRFRTAARGHHRGAVGYEGIGGYVLPLTYTDDAPFYGTYYDPSDVTRPIDPPLLGVPAAGILPVAERDPQIVDRGACRSQTVAVPSPSGADRSVTITRC